MLIQMGQIQFHPVPNGTNGNFSVKDHIKSCSGFPLSENFLSFGILPNVDKSCDLVQGPSFQFSEYGCFSKETYDLRIGGSLLLYYFLPNGELQKIQNYFLSSSIFMVRIRITSPTLTQESAKLNAGHLSIKSQFGQSKSKKSTTPINLPS